ncbi:MAG: SGNH/GDSL hydrolase family protein [Ruminococcaceae bacterium]|nr:SGNH/GDSL hydrolase family protein [Oscillospiraceae bacterium]
MKKIFAVLLSVLLAFGCLGIGASAEEALHYVVLGDSIAYGSGLTNPVQACYGKIVADTNGYIYANHSVPGHTTRNLINRLADETVLADVKNADIISISIGGNNFLMNNLIGLMADALIKKDYSEFDAIAADFYEQFGEIMDIINENNADAVVLLQTIYNPQTGHLRDVYQQGADRLNGEMVRFSQENPGEVILVDVATALSDTMDNFADDGIHPSALGNEKIAVAVLDTLADLSLGTVTQPVITEAGQDFQLSPLFSGFLNVYANLFHFLGLIYDFFASLFVMPL